MQVACATVRAHRRLSESFEATVEYLQNYVGTEVEEDNVAAPVVEVAADATATATTTKKNMKKKAGAGRRAQTGRIKRGHAQALGSQ